MMAINPQIAQPSMLTECAIIIAIGNAKPTKLPENAMAAAILFSRISLISACGVTDI